MKTTLIVAGLAASIVLGVVNYGKPVQVNVSPTPVEVNVPEQKAPVVNVAAPNVSVPAPVVNVPRQDQTFGAVVGPDTYFDYVANNDVRKSATRKAFTTATTTVCAIKSPSATSTLVFGGVNFTRSSTTASVVTLAKAATAFATTTALNTLSIAANGQGAQIATSSTATVGVVPAIIFAPNQYFVVGMQGGIGTFSPVGSCTAEFVRI